MVSEGVELPDFLRLGCRRLLNSARGEVLTSVWTGPAEDN
jgi:hypothetical protein